MAEGEPKREYDLDIGEYELPEERAQEMAQAQEVGKAREHLREEIEQELSEISFRREDLPENDDVFPALSDFLYALEKRHEAFLKAGGTEGDWMAQASPDEEVVRDLEKTYRIMRGELSKSLWDKQSVKEQRGTFRSYITVPYFPPTRGGPTDPGGTIPGVEPVPEVQEGDAPVSEVPGAMSGEPQERPDAPSEEPWEPELESYVFARFRDMLLPFQKEHETYQQMKRNLVKQEREKFEAWASEQGLKPGKQSFGKYLEAIGSKAA